ncbi:DUF5004 domain-containing protein [Flavobacterium sp. MAH-1]|uniref:DUF5004 domain-containing protein n=1 Tax=Flavobacterium agri TaxID=2743471 RepID=A0A7Y8Y1W4_9FLAO|nr:DUF5004 domain-containing protein [Flavobacterium agri]NUY81042.1 DUF5004 domain-containing protein [Flavobacterium agri]NYA71066.1 DUF5004 domain-containing protein [Flavobacterium agri]
MRIKPFLWLAVLGVFALGCNEQDDGEHVDPITLYEKINGNWGLMSVKMTDEVAKANGITPNEQNLSTYFNYEDFAIRFNVDEEMRPTTYEVSGDVPPLFAPTGYYELSSDFQPTGGNAVRVYLYSDAEHANKTDELRITSVPGSNEEMEIQVVRTSAGTPFVSYTFKLNAID